MSDVVIIGAHAAVARSLIDRLADRDGGEGVVAATTSEFVDSDLVLLDEAAIARGGLFVLAMGGDLPRKVAEGMAARGVPVLDIADVFDDGPWLWPTLVSGAAPTGGRHRLAVGPAAPLAAVISGLRVFQPQSVVVTTLESAVAAGQPGVDELSEQTRAVFAMRDAEPSVFPASLAFDPIPSLATGEAHPHEADAALVEQVQDGLQAMSVEAPSLSVTRVLVPTFVADSAVVHVRTEDPNPEVETVIAALRGARGVRYLQRPIVPALDGVDRDDVLVSRIRVAPHQIDLWLTYDRTRAGSAVPAALAVDGWRQAQASDN